LRTESIQKFFALQRVERVLLLRSLFLVGLIRGGLFVVSLSDLIKILHAVSRQSSSNDLYRNSISSIAWAVTVASRHIPRATCLVQGLATQVLLADEGIPSNLCIGVAKDDPLSFEAHAWVETAGRVVIGGPEQDRYTRLTSFDWRIQ
jgi:hypothetical protein